MPTRRSGGLGAPASRPAASAAAAATAESGGASTQPGDVSEAAIGAALDGATTAALDDVLGDVPRF